MTPAFCYPLPVARCPLPVACYPFPAARSLLPIACCPLPVTWNLKPSSRMSATIETKGQGSSIEAPALDSRPSTLDPPIIVIEPRLGGRAVDLRDTTPQPEPGNANQTQSVSLSENWALITDSATSSHEQVSRSRKQLACRSLRPTSWQLVATMAESVIKAEN